MEDAKRGVVEPCTFFQSSPTKPRRSSSFLPTRKYSPVYDCNYHHREPYYPTRGYRGHWDERPSYADRNFSAGYGNEYCQRRFQRRSQLWSWTPQARVGWWSYGASSNSWNYNGGEFYSDGDYKGMFIPPVQSVPKKQSEKVEAKMTKSEVIKTAELDSFYTPPVKGNYAYFCKSALNNLREFYHTAPNDIFIVTYPKSGTTWTQKIVLLLLGLKDVNGSLDPNKIIPWIEAAATNPSFLNWLLTQNTDKNLRHRVFKTHAEISKFPACTVDKESKVIYVTRNPKDVITSWYSHHQAIDFGRPEGVLPFDQFFEICLNGQAPSGSWWQHNFFWNEAYKSRKFCKMLMLVYEEMLADPAQAVLKIANFLGCQEKLTKQRLAHVVHESSFAKMKRDSMQFRWRYDRKFKSKFFRSGKVGRWQERLTPGQCRRIEERTQEYRRRGFNLPVYYEPLPCVEAEQGRRKGVKRGPQGRR